MHKVVAQYEQAPAVASNPANGVNNIPLQNNNGTAIPVPQEGTSGLNPEVLLDTLRQVSGASPQKALEYRPSIEQLWQESSNPEIKDALQKIMNAMDPTANPERRSKDPLTNEYDPTAAELARKLITKVNQMVNQKERMNNVSAKTYNFAREAAKKKKKTRGNPFRVLMGQVGKLLDHGLDKKEIVRFLEKKSTFSKETIDRCVDVVRDYNRKKHRENIEPGPEAEEDIRERLSMNEPLRKAYAEFFAANDVTDRSELVKQAQEMLDNGIGGHGIGTAPTAAQPEELRQARKTYNHARAVSAQTSRELTGIYAVQPDFTKRSTTELMARAEWLKSLKGFNPEETHSEGRKAASKQGVNEELKAIKKALIARGYDEQEFNFGD